MKKYHLHNGVDTLGPFDMEELKTKNITKSTPIWYEGLHEWKTAGDIPELATIFASIPPPIAVKAPPSITKPTVIQKSSYSEPINRKSNSGRNFLILIVLVALVGGYLYLENKNSQASSGAYSTSVETYKEKVMTVAEIEISQPTRFLTADGTYNRNFWGTKLKVHGNITNKATVATYKDAVVKVTYYSKTKTELGSQEYTIYETFPPNTTKYFELKIENYKDVNSIGWDVVSASAY